MPAGEYHGQGKNDGIVTAPEFQMTPSKSSRSKNELTHASECELCRPINVDGQQQGKKKKRGQFHQRSSRTRLDIIV
ncbi:hypothetical protein OUZ56_027927 [Daphnia magna]|uniref:Uncharacterized protein n=1 Tax=Daphnia magna TaxID=35525 RepID=A0ABR0B2D4_9CRUS|nr:hypothetical protein OUZ56_027927 [Daphnia magna]